MVVEVSELAPALLDLDDDSRHFILELEEHGVLVESLACGMLEKAVPTAVVRWMAVGPSFLFGSFRHSHSYSSNSLQSHHSMVLVWFFTRTGCRSVVLLCCC